MNTVLVAHPFPSGQCFEIVQGDITTETVDAIVNAANSYLQHGGGVAGVISLRGGLVIQQESDAWLREHGPVSHAGPAVTSGGKLHCRYVIHAVGPVWGDGDEDTKLASAVTGSLKVAERLGLSSIAFPAISTGIFGFPKERAAGVIFAAIEGYFADNPFSGVKMVRLTLYDKATVDAFLGVWSKQDMIA